MSLVRRAVKGIIGLLMGYEAVTRVSEREIDIRSYIAYSLLCREDIRRLKRYKDRHKGGRCFIIGNGPSLAKMDLRPLKNEITFGLNRIYLLFESLGFETTYYVAVNQYVVEQCADEIKRIKCPKFIKWEHRRFLAGDTNAIFLRTRYTPLFSADAARDGVWEGATVTYVAMQLAFYMGFEEVILIGADHEFKTTGEPNKLVVSKGDDPNHFRPDYFGRGFKWQLPDLEGSEKAYAMARDAYQVAGRRILDATVGGKLNIFPKVDYNTVVGLRA